MANKPFASLVPRVNPSVPGCPYATIVQHIRDAAISACERTLAWRYIMPVFTLYPRVQEYFYAKPNNAEVHAVLAALVNCTPLQLLTLEQATKIYKNIVRANTAPIVWGTANIVLGVANIPWGFGDLLYSSASAPRAVTQFNSNKFVILPIPDDKQPYTIEMILALKPARSASDMDEAVLNELEDAIVHGALQRLLVLPKQKWEDRELAAYHAKQYLSQITERRARTNLTNARATLRVQIPSF